MAAGPANPDRRKRGYRRLAEFMAWDPALAIFPRFRAANNLNLLLLQAEISELEDDINLRSEVEDSLGDAQKSCDFTALRDDREDDTRWKKCLELRAKLTEYSMSPRDGRSDWDATEPIKQTRLSFIRSCSTINLTRLN
jgi:hypothetical protein